MNTTSSKCPFCAEDIKSEAKICKHCHSDLTDVLREGQKNEGVSNGKNQKQSNRRSGFATFCRFLRWVFGVLFVFMGITFLSLGSFDAYLVYCMIALAILILPAVQDRFVKRFDIENTMGLNLLLAVLILFVYGYGIASLDPYAEASKKPSPVITIISDTGPQGARKEYALELKAENATKVDVNGATLEGQNGVYKTTVQLKHPSTRILVFASNEYNSSSKNLDIVRDATEDEKKEAEKKAEELKAQEERERQDRLKWERSKAGQICKRHPGWSHEVCDDVAATRYWVGMTKEMLFESFGKPSSSNPSNYGSGTSWQYCWYSFTPSCFYDHDDDGVIDAYN